MAIKVDYDYMQEAFARINELISGIQEKLNTSIPVESIDGDSKPVIENKINEIKNKLHEMEQPLTELNKKTDEVREEYRAREAKIRAELS